MIFYIWVFFETVEKIHISLNSEKIFGLSPWRAIWIYDNISPKFSLDKEYFGTTWIENQTTYFVFNNFFSENRTLFELTYQNKLEKKTGYRRK